MGSVDDHRERIPEDMGEELGWCMGKTGVRQENKRKDGDRRLAANKITRQNISMDVW